MVWEQGRRCSRPQRASSGASCSAHHVAPRRWHLLRAPRYVPADIIGAAFWATWRPHSGGTQASRQVHLRAPRYVPADLIGAAIWATWRPRAGRNYWYEIQNPPASWGLCPKGLRYLSL